MYNIKEKFSLIFDNIEKSIKEFIITYTIIFLTTLFLLVTVENSWIQQTTIRNIVTFGMITVISVFFVENYFYKERGRIIGYIASIVIGALTTCLIYTKSNLFGMIYNGINEAAIRVTVGYCIILVLMSLYKLYKKQTNEFNLYFTKVFQNVFNTTIIYGIVNIGLMILTFIFIYLILGNVNDDNFYIRIQIALLGFLYIPGIIVAFSQTEKIEINKFIKTLIIYVLLPLIIIAILIIYLYMAKIFIVHVLPSNMIYRIIAGIFIAAVPTWIMASTYRKQNKLIESIINIIPFVLIPFLFLQIYSMSIRVGEYGITPLRYISYAMVLYEAVAITLMIYKKSNKLDYVLTVGAAIVLIIFISPFNFETVSNISQKNILTKYMKEGDTFINLPDNNKKYVVSSYRYLKEQYNYEKYIPEYILKYDNEILNNSNYNYYKNIDYTNSSSVINVEEYKKLIPVTYSEYNKYDDYGKKTDNIEGIDVNNLLNILIEKNESEENGTQKFLTNNNTIKITEEIDIYIVNISIEYDQSNKNISYAYLSGYILVK